MKGWSKGFSTNGGRVRAHLRRIRLFDALLLPVLLVLGMLILLFKRHALSHLPTLPLTIVSTLSSDSPLKVLTARVPLHHVHTTKAYHARAWVLVFDSHWRLALYTNSDSASQTVCSSGLPLRVHVRAGSDVTSAAADAAQVRQADMLHLGGAFRHDSAREWVVAYSIMTRDATALGEITRIVKPVDYVREEVHGEDEECIEMTMWMKRAVAMALWKMRQNGFVPRLNPMEDARFDDPLCCEQGAGEGKRGEEAQKVQEEYGDLTRCARPCNEPGVKNILAVFPQAR